LVWVEVEGEAAFSEAGVVALGELRFEFVEGSGESFELAVGHLVEIAYCGQELDVLSLSSWWPCICYERKREIYFTNNPQSIIKS